MFLQRRSLHERTTISDDYLFHAGEATVLARDGQFTDAMPEILIGHTNVARWGRRSPT